VLQKLIRRLTNNYLITVIKKSSIAIISILLIVVSVQAEMQVEVVDANPTWGKPGTPIPPITDPPQIIIESPNNGAYNNPVPLIITIIIPDSWVPEQGIDSANKLVGGRNTLRSINCIIDGQSIILWNGTLITPYGITYFMPKVSQFSADITVGKGQHNLQVSVLALSQYRTEGIVPFSDKEYLISANQSSTFTVIKASDAILSPKIDNIKNPYPFPQKTLNQPTSTPAPNPTFTIINPNSSNSALQSDFLSHNAFSIAVLSVFGLVFIILIAMFYKRRKRV
jgi:hypothetical protein